MDVIRPPQGVIEATYRTLRTRLVKGEVRPDTKLKISDLASAMGVSTGVVREALTRLSAEGLVSATPQRGFRVAPMSAAELRDITRVRVEIEGLCIRRALQLGDIEWEAGVVGAYHRLQHTPDGVAQESGLPAQSWTDAHTYFHDCIVAACDSPWLLKLREQLHVQSERYRLISARTIRHDERSLAMEHQAIFEAVKARDADTSIALISEHFSDTARGLLERDSEHWLSH
jgi:GntR family carbon starvation induced transcriptional regulator